MVKILQGPNMEKNTHRNRINLASSISYSQMMFASLFFVDYCSCSSLNDSDMLGSICSR